MFRTVRVVLGLALGFVVLAGATGCGKGTGTLKGKVYYNNAPLPGGNVTFISVDGKRAASAAIKEDGSYEVVRVPKGDVKILIETESLNPRNKGQFSYAPPKDQGGDMNYKPPGSQDLAKRYKQIPRNYAEEETTPLTMTVTGGAQEHDIKFP